MNIEFVKKMVESGQAPKFIVFQSDCNFIPDQYVKEIAHLSNKQIQYADLATLQNSAFSMFSDNDNIMLCHVDSIDSVDDLCKENVYIVCKKVGKNLSEDYVCKVPKLEKWQIDEMIDTMCFGAENSALQDLHDSVDSDAYFAYNECEKVQIFSEQERKYVLKDFLADGTISGCVNKNVFNLVNSLCERDIQKAKNELISGKYSDDEVFGIVTLLSNNFRNILLIQGSPCPTADKLGMNSKQFYVVSKLTGRYSTKALTKILYFLNSVDEGIKTGNFIQSDMISYIVTKILSER